VRTPVGEDERRCGVWAVWPKADEGIGVRLEYAGGWLALRRGSERLRFAPVPPTWQTMPHTELVRCFAAAHAPEKSRLSVLASHVVPRV
jgi:hypothetical protein